MFVIIQFITKTAISSNYTFDTVNTNAPGHNKYEHKPVEEYNIVTYFYICIKSHAIRHPHHSFHSSSSSLVWFGMMMVNFLQNCKSVLILAHLFLLL